MSADTTVPPPPSASTTIPKLLEQLRAHVDWNDSTDFDEALEQLGFEAGDPDCREFVEMHRWGPVFRDTYELPGVGWFQVYRRVGNENQTDGVRRLAEVFPCEVTVTRYQIDPVEADPVGAPTDLGIRELTAISVERAERWHRAKPWNLAEWSNALAGEVGEACNITKKMLRHWDGIQGPNDPPMEVLEAKLRKELADAQSYLVLLADAACIDLAAATVEVFNEVSDREGWTDLKLPERTPWVEIVPLAEIVNLGPDYDDGAPDWTGEPDEDASWPDGVGGEQW